MLYEWYSGSDLSLEIPRRLTKMYARGDRLSVDQRIEELSQLLRAEGDTNWRGYLRYSIAQEHASAEREKDATKAFLEALAEFDTFAGSFENVVEQYCRTVHRLLMDHFLDVEDFEGAVSAGLEALSWLDRAGFDAFETSMFYSALGSAFNGLGNKLGHKWLFDAAATCKVRAHHAEPEDPGRLEAVLYAYFNAGRLQDCRRVYRLFEEVADDYEGADDVRQFMRERVETNAGREN